MTDRMSLSAQADPEVAAALDQETLRQHEGLEMIASENFVSEAVLEAAGSDLHQQIRRRLSGAALLWRLRIRRRGRESGARARQTNLWRRARQCAAALRLAGQRRCVRRVLKAGDTILGLDLSHGGHLTHGHKLSFSGKLYHTKFYGVRKDNELIDYDQMEEVAERERPKVIIGGGSAYPRRWDFARMRAIADKVGATYVFDMAHIAGLVAGGVHPSPVPHAHITTTTTHKTLRGPRAGLIVCGKDYVVGPKPETDHRQGD